MKKFSTVSTVIFLMMLCLGFFFGCNNDATGDYDDISTDDDDIDDISTDNDDIDDILTDDNDVDDLSTDDDGDDCRPLEEVCDGKNNDCDGYIDEGCSGTLEVTINILDTNNGKYLDRIYLLHLPNLPAGLDSSNNYPLVFALHGSGGTAWKTEHDSDFSAFADEEGIIVVYPQALGKNDPDSEWHVDFTPSEISEEGRTTMWNVDHGAGYGPYNNIDDTGFFAAMLEKLTAELPVDENRIFASGISNGGTMTRKLTIAFPDYFGAAALVSTAMGGEEPPEEPPPDYVPIPTIIFHGTSDDCTLYAGGPLNNEEGAPIMLAAPLMAGAIAAFNNCSEDPVITHETIYFELEIWTYQDCEEPVIFYTIIEGGHRWYSQETPIMFEFFMENSS